MNLNTNGRFSLYCANLSPNFLDSILQFKRGLSGDLNTDTKREADGSIKWTGSKQRVALTMQNNAHQRVSLSHSFLKRMKKNQTTVCGRFLVMLLSFVAASSDPEIKRTSAPILLLDLNLPSITPDEYLESFWHDTSFYENFLKESGTFTEILDCSAERRLSCATDTFSSLYQAYVCNIARTYVYLNELMRNEGGSSGS